MNDHTGGFLDALMAAVTDSVDRGKMTTGFETFEPFRNHSFHHPNRPDIALQTLELWWLSNERPHQLPD